MTINLKANVKAKEKKVRLSFDLCPPGDVSGGRGRGFKHPEALEHAPAGAVENVLRVPKVCVRHQLSAPHGHAEKNVCAAGGPVLAHGDTRHEDAARAADGGASVVSDLRSCLPVVLLAGSLNLSL